MDDAWIPQDAAVWFSMLSLTAGLAALEFFVRCGEHRGLITAVWGVGALIGAGFLIAAAAALALGQPWWVLVALGVPGAVMTPALGW